MPAADQAPATEAVPGAEGTGSMLPQFAPGLNAADYTPWGMFVSADAVVKGVILALLFASLVTWTVLLAKSLELYVATRHQRHALAALGRARSLGDAAHGVGKSAVAAAFVQSAVAEIDLSASALDDRDGIKERVVSRLDRLETAAGRRITLGIGLLATIGATAPFVGLFGTVWGIMNSFIGIANAQTTNLAVVAPGIAEALLATAIGLVVAIPAVVFYNHFARRIAAYRGLVADSAAAVLRIVSRDLSRAAIASGNGHSRRNAAE
jgi:biopolymer transport protein ExbB